MILMNRKAKQHENRQLKKKGPYCRLRCSSEAIFSFFENFSPLQDVVPYDNVKLIPHALEWGNGFINLQSPMRKPGKNSGLPATCLD